MFDDQFFKAIGLENASAEHKAQLTEKLAEMVQTRVAGRLAEVLTEDQVDHFTGLIDAGQEDEAFTYLEDNCPEYAALLQEEFEAVEELLLRDMQTVMQNIDAEPTVATPASAAPVAPATEAPQTRRDQPGHHVAHQ